MNRDGGVRAGILVTGTEVLSGYVTDRNGPWLSERLADLGVEVEEITVVGDRPEDLEGALRHMRDQDLDLIVTSGGLGPTADDLTAEVVGRFAGQEARPRRGDGGEDRPDHRPLRAPPALRPRGRARGEPQAGDGARGGGGDRPGRHGAGPGRPRRRPGRDRAAGPAARAPGHVAARPGRGAGPGGAGAARSRTRRCRSACSASRSPSSPRRCARSRTRATARPARGHHLSPRRGAGHGRAAPRRLGGEPPRGCAPASPSVSGSSRTPRAAIDRGGRLPAARGPTIAVA